MKYGQLSKDQKKTIKPFIRNRVVHDLGAGDGRLSAELVDLGARRVVAVDEDAPWRKLQPPLPRGDKIRYVETSFAYFTEPVRTAFVSWPYQTSEYRLVAILREAKTVIYLGTNFDGTACGAPDFWWHVTRREVLAHEPYKKNTLIVYGAVLPDRRALLPEEDAAMTGAHIRRFEDAYPKSPTSRLTVAAE